MGLAGVVFALVTVGYIVGVWTACVVLKQPQRAYEEAVQVSPIEVPANLLREASLHGMQRT